jgi:CRP-like cAMP-binding protein
LHSLWLTVFLIAESNPDIARKRQLDFSSTVFRKKFGAGMTVGSYRDKEIIFSQGDAADALFYIHTGAVKLTAVWARKNAIIAFPAARQLLRRSLSGRTISANLHGQIDGSFEPYPAG